MNCYHIYGLASNCWGILCKRFRLISDITGIHYTTKCAASCYIIIVAQHMRYHVLSNIQKIYWPGPVVKPTFDRYSFLDVCLLFKWTNVGRYLTISIVSENFAKVGRYLTVSVVSDNFAQVSRYLSISIVSDKFAQVGRYLTVSVDYDNFSQVGRYLTITIVYDNFAQVNNFIFNVNSRRPSYNITCIQNAKPALLQNTSEVHCLSEEKKTKCTILCSTKSLRLLSIFCPRTQPRVCPLIYSYYISHLELYYSK